MDYFHFDDYDVACNWKLAMDTFGETYHFGALHSETITLFMPGNVQCFVTLLEELRQSPRATARVGAHPAVVWASGGPPARRPPAPPPSSPTSSPAPAPSMPPTPRPATLTTGPTAERQCVDGAMCVLRRS